MNRQHADTVVVGAGIVGLAHALAAARLGRKVVVFERDDFAVGASIRNFGMIWAVGQQRGKVYQRALRSREVWLEVAAKTGLWAPETGSLHLAHHEDEVAVLEEFLQLSAPARERGARMLTAEEAAARSGYVRRDGLHAAMWSPTEVNVDPRHAIPAVAEYLAAEHGVEFRFGTHVRGIAMPTVSTTAGDWDCEQVYVCSGNDFASLYPEVFADSGLTRCKLQMMRTAPLAGGGTLGPMLCGGLTLLHYASFDGCPSRTTLAERMGRERPFHREHGIHVLVSQTADGRLTLGDSHAYGTTHPPFADGAVDEAVLDYLDTFALRPPEAEITERWVGYYPSLRDGRTELVVDPEPGVTVVNGVGGAGMTLSFGLAEENLAR
ncbi:TIGR03364 family FAD-dependent oxidoreductase [Streptomyces carpinensis]|uniref:TIGR03364 family FAD-dependent oxidoreductase n=1 Tax=Streptomyces carpinensis TaxID=66369 RepID=A0ABV1W6M2_9ACTN|nr:TIGR03364 family FAD-dependent oxidoreductase [Streptomyces carpinensis]